MVYARFGSLVFVQWKDSNLVKNLSTIHLSPKHFLPKEYSKHVWRRRPTGSSLSVDSTTTRSWGE
ncbi:unnamed protein product [Ectocarpus sp. 4 AP-2014]